MRVLSRWLAPVQVGIVPISQRHLGYAEKIQATLQNAGLRVEIDHRNEKMGAKIRDFTMQKLPYISCGRGQGSGDGCGQPEGSGRGRQMQHAGKSSSAAPSHWSIADR